MRIKKTHLAALIALVISCPVLPVRGQVPVYSDADLSGTYVYSFVVNDPGWHQWDRHCTNDENGVFAPRGGDGWSCFGTLTADGAGSLIGTRTVVRRSRDAPGDGGTNDRWCPEETEVVQQSFTGTYHVSAQGLGVATLAVNPRPDWKLGMRQFDTEAEEQVLRFSVTPGGTELRGVLEITGLENHNGAWNAYRRIIAGSATRATSPCPEAPAAPWERSPRFGR